MFETSPFWHLPNLQDMTYLSSRHVASRRGLPTPTGTAPHRCWHPKHQRVLGSRASREAPQKMSDLGEMLGIFVEQSGTYDICPTFFLAFILYLGEILWNNRSSVSTTSSMIHHNISWFLHLTSHLLPGKPPCHQATPGLKFNLAVLTGQLAGLAWWVQPKLYHFPM